MSVLRSDHTQTLRSKPVQSSCLPGAGLLSGIVKNPLLVLDRNPAWAQTLFLCLQQEMEAWGKKISMVYLVSSLFFVIMPGQGPHLGKKSNLNLSFSENQLIPVGKVTLSSPSPQLERSMNWGSPVSGDLTWNRGQCPQESACTPGF